MRKTKKRIAAGALAVGMALQGFSPVPLKAVTYNKIIEITKDVQVVDSYRGVDALYRNNAYETELPWNCAGYIRSFYQTIYGVNVTNLFRGQIPNGNKDGKYVEFVQVNAPKAGDICGEVKTNSNHWTIVRKVLGETIVVIEQNYKWMEDDRVYCQINRKINYKDGDYRFYRLASRTKERELITASSESDTSALNTTEKTTAKTTVKTTEKKTEKTTAKATEKKTEKTTAKEAEKKTDKTTAKKIEKKTEKTTAKTAEKKTDKTTAKKTEKKTEKTTVKTTEKKTEKATAKTTEKKTGKAIVSNITEIALNPKASFELSVTYKTSGKTPKKIAYSSSDKSVAAVSKSGKVAAKKSGTAVIVMSVDGEKTSCTVHVNDSDSGITEKAAEKTAVKQTDKAAAKKTEKATAKTAVKKTEKTTEKSTAKTTSKKTEKATEKTAAKKTEKATEKKAKK